MKAVCTLLLASLAAAPVAAQNSSVIFTGRFPFVSLDTVNERTGGSITQLSEFAFNVVTPGSGAVAYEWVPATAQQCFIGDTSGTNDYTPLRGLKPSYGSRINIAGPFVRHADKQSFDPRKIYWTVRDQEASIDIQVHAQGGTQVVSILPGDFVRMTGNGDLEYFITQAHFATAVGAQTGSFAHGASALCQDDQLNLYYSPAEGGHWVNGNLMPGGPLFAFDGGLIKIPAAAITYDAQGNVQAILPDSAYILFDEITLGPIGGPSIRQMVSQNSGAQNFTGAPFPITTNMVGLDLDPNGGTLTSAWGIGDPAAGGTLDTVPNFVFTWDSGTGGGTIFSTAPNVVGQPGSVAVINGVKCGSDTTGVPADGSWLGTVLDVANFQPTMMGLAIIPALPYQPFVADVPDFGALDPLAATFDLDFGTVPGALIGFVLQFGPRNPGLVPPSLDFGAIFGTASWNTLFTIPTAFNPNPPAFTLGLADNFGYATFSLPNPNTPSTQGLVLMFHGVAVHGTGFQVSNPTILQYK